MNLDISGVDLTGQVAIVIGSEFALSRIIAQALESAGAAVALVVKTERELVEMTDLIYDTDGRIRIIVADTSNQNAVERVVQNYKDHLGFITMVVNVVDIARLPVSLWQRMVQYAGSKFASFIVVDQNRLTGNGKGWANHQYSRFANIFTANEQSDSRGEGTRYCAIFGGLGR